jgi:hypothetical protein
MNRYQPLARESRRRALPGGGSRRVLARRRRLALSPSGDALSRASQTPELAQPGELSVLLCGTGAPLPDPLARGRLHADRRRQFLYVVDTGIGSARNLLNLACATAESKGVFITHLHSDHIAELGELRLQTWVAGRKPLKVVRSAGRRRRRRRIQRSLFARRRLPHRPSRRSLPAARGCRSRRGSGIRSSGATAPR